MPILSNQRQETFAQHVAQGSNGAAAYRNAYGAHGASAEANASRLLRNDKVRARVQELQGEAAKAAVMTLAEQRLLLASVARGEQFGAKISDRLRAIEIDAKLAGNANDKNDKNDKALQNIMPRIIIRNPGDPGREPRNSPRAPDVDGEERAPIVFNVPEIFMYERGERPQNQSPGAVNGTAASARSLP